MASVYGVMVENLSDESINKMVTAYTNLGWQLQSLGEHGSHLLLTFVWPHDSDPPHPDKTW